MAAAVMVRSDDVGNSSEVVIVEVAVIVVVVIAVTVMVVATLVMVVVIVAVAVGKSEGRTGGGGISEGKKKARKAPEAEGGWLTNISNVDPLLLMVERDSSTTHL